MNTRQIQYAILLSKELNFSQVAQSLGISQPSLSKQIKSLEDELGVKLFDRNHSPMSLTPAGEFFIKNAQELLYKEDQILKSLSKFKSGENGSLVIGVTPFRSLYLMPEIVKGIKQKFPGVRVTLHEASSAQLRNDAAEGKFDFAVVNLPVDESLLDIRPLEPDTLVLAVPRKIADKEIATLNNSEYTDLSQFSHLPFVVLSPSQELRQLFDKLCVNAQFDPDIAVEVVGISTAWAMAKAGVGATLVPLQFVENQHIGKDLVLYRIKNNLYSRRPAIVSRKDQYISDFARYAIELLKEQKDN